VDAWSERFVTLEQRHLDLSREVYRRVEDIQREVNVKAIEAQADLETAAKQIRKEAAEQRKEWDEAMRRLESAWLARPESSRPMSETRTQDSSRPATQGLRTFEPLSALPASDVYPPTSKPLDEPLSMESAVQQPPEVKIEPHIHSNTQVADLPKWEETREPVSDATDQFKPAEPKVVHEKSFKKVPSKPVRNPKSADEPSRGLAFIMPEPSLSHSESVQTDAIIPPPEPVYEGLYHHLEARVTALERPMSSVSSHTSRKSLSRRGSNPSPTDLGEDLRMQHSAMLQEVTTLKALYSKAVSARTSQPTGDDLIARVTSLEEQIQSLSETVGHTEAFSQEIEKLKGVCTALGEDLQTLNNRPISAVSRPDTSQQPILSKGSSQRDVLGDVSILLAEDRTTVTRISAQTQQDCQRRFQLQEKAILTIAQELEALRSVSQVQAQDLEAAFLLVKRVEKQGVETQRTCEHEIERLAQAWDKEENPDASKSLAALRGIIGKVQREQREQASVLANLSVPDLPDSQGSYFPLRLQRQEAQVKHLTGLLQQVSEQMEAMQVQWRRQGESQTAARLAELEALRNEVGVVMKKASEGARLSEKDVERLHALYDKVELKGDRTEVAQKVDRAELKKAYSTLTKKIENFREEVKQGLETERRPSPEPAATTRRLDQECLSCGQEVPQGREERGLRRFGHGFSRLLPMLNSLAGSKQRALSTARLKSSSPY